MSLIVNKNQGVGYHRKAIMHVVISRLLNPIGKPNILTVMKMERANKQDHLRAVINFQIEMALESEGLKLDPQTVEKGVLKVFENPAIGNYFVYVDGNQVLGCLLIQNEWSDWRNGVVLWIHSVYILPQFRKNGIFKKMYEDLKLKVENDPNLLGLRLYVDKKNVGAQKVYEKLNMGSDHYMLYEWLKG
jgi:ribosomal protein S18 acetylase RimI-like enzyme